jgi:hypothetical protein
MLLENELLLESELLLEAAALINSKEDQIAQIESDMTCKPDCGFCGFGHA